MRTLAILAAIALVSCAPTAQVSKGGAEVVLEPAGFPLANSFAAGSTPVALRGNTEIARDFMDLSFAMENGQALPTFSRFEGPVTVALAGQVPPTAPGDLAALIARLRNEAGIGISMAAPGQPAAITVEFQSKASLRRLAPNAACFVVPNASSMAEYRSHLGRPQVDWANVMRRERAVVLVPSDTSPQEIRDCLHEELAQALGPLNDLYRLQDSVFNDDNFNSVLTGFDMLVLRIYNDPQLQSGMTANQVAAVIPGLVAANNPGGVGLGSVNPGPTPRAWVDAIGTAVGQRGSSGSRMAAAERALKIARTQGWSDARLAFSHFALARLSVGSDRGRAVSEFTAAAGIYGRLPGGQVQVAHIEMQLAAIALAAGQPEQVIALADRAMPVVKRYENAALLATLMLLKAAALEQLGQTQAATALRLDSQPWARYGFGPDALIRQRMREIATVGARGAKG